MSETKIQEIEVRKLSDIKLVGFRVLCPGDQYIVEIPKATLLLSERINEIKHITEPIQMYGAFVVENKTEEEDGYWIGVEVDEYEDIPSDMVTLTIPPQTYAVIRHQDTNNKIRDSYDILHKWIYENNYIRLTNKWHLEKYHRWNDTENVDVELFDTVGNK